MPTWLSVVLLIAVVLVAGLLWERWRQRGVDDFITASGFRRLDPASPGWQAMAATLVQRMHPSGARRWGLALEGTLDGVQVTVAEHESSRGLNRDARWFTLVMWPVRQKTAGAVVLMEAPDDAVAAVVSAATTLGTGTPVAERLGLAQPVADEDQPVVAGRFQVRGVPPARDAWLTAARAGRLDELPREGRFVREIEYAAWRFEGAITREVLERVRAALPAVRQAIE